MIVGSAAILLPSIQTPASGTAWLTRQVVRCEGPPPLEDDGALGAVASATIEALEAAISKHGRKPELLDLLGRANVAAGNFGDALACFETSGNVNAAQSTRKLLNLKTAFEFKHPDRRVLHIKSLTGYQAPVMAILHVRDTVGSYDSLYLGTSVSDLRLTLDAGGKSVTLGPFKRQDFDIDEINEAQLYAIDLDHDGRQEAVLSGVFYGASWTPSFLSIVGQENRRWVKTREIDFHDPAWVQDLNKDGKWEFGGVNVIGMSLSHAEQPRWLEIYQYSGGHTTPADTHFSTYYRRYENEIDSLLKEYPDDTPLLAYRGRTARLLGKISDAKRFERQALKHLVPKQGLSAGRVKNTIWRPFDPINR